LKRIATDTIKAVSRKIDPNRRHNTFEVRNIRKKNNDIIVDFWIWLYDWWKYEAMVDWGQY